MNDPLTGSFTQPDSIVPNAMDPRAWNRFGYVYGNPANFTDPSGHIPLPLIAVGLFALGGFGGHLAATSAGYEVGSSEWWGAVSLSGAVTLASGGLAYIGTPAWVVFGLAIAGDTAVEVGILDSPLGPSLIWSVGQNLLPDVIGYGVGRAAKYFNVPRSIRGGKGFQTFDELKDYLGRRGRFRHWHHIVEQNPINISRFPSEWIHNTRNVVDIPGGYPRSLHSKVTGFYNSKQPFSRPLKVREWVSTTMSFDEQYEFGVEVLRNFGYKDPLP